MILAGALFLIAAPQYAEAATSSVYDGGSAYVAAMGIPAFFFTVAGLVGVIGGVAMVVVAICESR